MAIDPAISEIFAAARREGRRVLLEPEALAVAEVLGLAAPAQLLVSGAEDAAAADLDALPGRRVVVKVVSAEIPHKSDVGGVAVVDKDSDAVAEVVAEMEERLEGRAVAGYSLNQFVPHDASFGGELLLGMRWSEDFGPIVTLGPGGVYAEHMAAHLQPGEGTAVLSPSTARSAGAIAAALADKAFTPAVIGGLRGRPPRLEISYLADLLARWLAFAEAAMPGELTELEVNPLVLVGGRPVALDALLRLGDSTPAPTAERPAGKLRRLLEPRSAAVIGVSRKLNPGRVILRNMLAAGFDPRRLYVLKPGEEEIEGCRCYPDVASLPEAVDLLVVSVEAARVPELLEEVITGRKAESLIVIPGGLGEVSGSETHARRLRDALDRSREMKWGGPVVNGGNCLGVRSAPGRYDTLFIPRHKLRFPEVTPTPLALIAQSGAFAVARASQLWTLNPRYLVTIGNQLDLTAGDYLAYLKDDPEVEVFACYVEGFRPLDGRRWLEAAAEITASGRPVILYRAGRTAAGASAAASHTASIAGDYTVTRELARAAGVVVAESLADFDDLTRLFCLLRGKAVRGLRLGAFSNAGFECVALADNLGPFRLARFGEVTTARLEELLARHHLESVVEVHNPLDATPILDDEAFEAAARVVLEEIAVDAAILGCVPLTGALATLPPGADHGEDAGAETAVAGRLVRLHAESAKPWVAVVDGGPLYDPVARLLEEGGVPTFRTADRALRLFGACCQWRLSHPPA